MVRSMNVYIIFTVLVNGKNFLNIFNAMVKSMNFKISLRFWYVALMLERF